MRLAIGESTTSASEGLTSECLEVILWLRRHNSTSKCLDGERHGTLWFSAKRCLDSSQVWVDKNDGERRQDIASVTVDRGWMWLEEKRAKMRERSAPVNTEHQIRNSSPLESGDL